MGKTALLRRFVDVHCNREDDPDSPMAVVLDFGGLRDERDLGEALRAAARNAPWWRKMVSALGMDAAKRLKLSSTFKAAKSLDPGNRSRMRPVCVVVDEIQNVGPEHKSGLSALHNASFGLPILPVFAGLGDSFDALREAGISRLSDTAAIHLGLLSKEEAREAVGILFDRHRVAGGEGERGRWIATIADDCARFPQHLHVGMREAARVLAERGGILDPDGLVETRRLGAESRRRYYRGRLSPMVEDQPETLLALARIASGNEPRRTKTRARLVDAAVEQMRTQGDAYDAPTRGEARRIVNAMIHDGILQINHIGSYEVPIPSMRTWLLHDYAREVGA